MGRDKATTKLDLTPALSAHSSLIIAQSIPLDRCPAAVYLAQLKQSSRRPQKQALDLVASLLTSGTADCLTLNWAALRYQHTAAVRGRLLDTYAPATANRILSALRGVLEQAWLLVDDQASTVFGLKITAATTAEARMWYEQLGAGGDWAEPDGITFMTIRTAIKSGTRLFLAWQDGQPVGGGALEVHGGVAALMAADTLPDFRHQGIHTALMQVRLAAAAEAGCELAMVHGSPGGQSQGNILRSGFQLAYTSVALLRAL